MLDFISFYIKNISKINEVYFNNSLGLIYEEETQRSNANTGEMLTFYHFKYSNFKFIFLENAQGIKYELKIQGSIHYYYNGGKHNANRLTFYEFSNAVNKLLLRINLHPIECFLKPCEYGFNLLFFDADTIPYNCMAENRKLFHYIDEFPCAISGVKKNDSQFKLYSKGNQYPEFTEYPTLRIENKNNRSRSWQKLGVFTIKDLLLIENHFKIYEQFLYRFDQIILFDDGIPINKKNQRKIAQFSNINEWRKLIKKGSQNKLYNRRKKQLETLSQSEGSNIKERLKNLIHKEFLMNYNLLEYPNNNVTI